MNRPSALRVWAGAAMRKAAKCKWCRQAIVFRTTDRGKLLPMKPTAMPIGATEDSRGCKFETMNWSDVHRCDARPKLPKRREEERFVPPPLQRGLF